MTAKKVWCVKAQDGWHAAKPNRAWPGEQTNVATKCGSVIVLPIGCERRFTTCKDCAAAIRKVSEQ